MERERRSRDYWREQLSEYWDGGLTIQEYCELKDLPYENVRRWIGILKKEREEKDWRMPCSCTRPCCFRRMSSTVFSIL